MAKLAAFNRFINENEDSLNRLRDLGMAPKAPVDERWQEFVNDWSYNPEIQSLVRQMKDKTEKLMNSYFDEDDYNSQDWDQIMGYYWEQSSEDLGLVEFLVSTNSL